MPRSPPPAVLRMFHFFITKSQSAENKLRRTGPDSWLHPQLQAKKMATTPLHITPPPTTTTTLRPPETTTRRVQFTTKPILSFLKRRAPLSDSSVPISSESPTSEPQKPAIELEFIGEGDGVERARVVSGEKVLRSIMADNKIELYATYRKLMNCGGRGYCGTCIVEILYGKDLLNERTDAELRLLKKKPESWRLACQTIVGNKENSGKVVVQRMPQWKKK